MRWEKKGCIYKPSNNQIWSNSHAQVPSALKINDDTLRIYFGTRDKHNRSVTTFIEVDPESPERVKNISNRQVLGLGASGCFDDCGALPSWLIKNNGIIYLFYTGWNLSTTVPYRNSIGLAISEDNGYTFKRRFNGPILDRTHLEPFFCATPCVIIENGIWRMWYLSCTKWERVNGKAEPCYNIKYAESKDGIIWNREGIICINYQEPEESAIARPCIIKRRDIYQMWYSKRGSKNYRTRLENSYRIGYAESKDGVKWERNDELSGIDLSKEGWDSEMMAYPFVYENKNDLYMLYNGNGFGKSGIGFAILNN